MYIYLFRSSGLIVFLSLLISISNNIGRYPVAASQEPAPHQSQNERVMAQNISELSASELPELPGVDLKVNFSLHPLKDPKVQWKNPNWRLLKINYRITNHTSETILILNRLPKWQAKQGNLDVLEYDKNRLAWRMIYGEKDHKNSYEILGYDLGKFPLGEALTNFDRSSDLPHFKHATGVVFIPGVTELKPNEHFSELVETRWVTDGSGIDFKRFCVSMVRQSDDKNRTLKQQPFAVPAPRGDVGVHFGSILEHLLWPSEIKEYGFCRPISL